jgi:clan AA aspartic protease
MITGVVTASYEAVIRVRVRGSGRRQREIDAVVDTGFDGWLSLPSELIGRLGLPWRRRGRALLADGSETIFDIYEASVIWDKRLCRVSVDEANAIPLVGMRLLSGYKLSMEVREAGQVVISRLSRERGP